MSSTHDITKDAIRELQALLDLDQSLIMTEKDLNQASLNSLNDHLKALRARERRVNNLKQLLLLTKDKRPLFKVRLSQDQVRELADLLEPSTIKGVSNDAIQKEHNKFMLTIYQKFLKNSLREFEIENMKLMNEADEVKTLEEHLRQGLLSVGLLKFHQEIIVYRAILNQYLALYKFLYKTDLKFTEETLPSFNNLIKAYGQLRDELVQAVLADLSPDAVARLQTIFPTRDPVEVVRTKFAFDINKDRVPSPDALDILDDLKRDLHLTLSSGTKRREQEPEPMEDDVQDITAQRQRDEQMKRQRMMEEEERRRQHELLEEARRKKEEAEAMARAAAQAAREAERTLVTLNETAFYLPFKVDEDCQTIDDLYKKNKCKVRFTETLPSVDVMGATKPSKLFPNTYEDVFSQCDTLNTIFGPLKDYKPITQDAAGKNMEFYPQLKKIGLAIAHDRLSTVKEISPEALQRAEAYQKQYLPPPTSIANNTNTKKFDLMTMKCSMKTPPK